MMSSWLFTVHTQVDLKMQDYESVLIYSQKNGQKHLEVNAWMHYGRILEEKRPAEYDKAEEYILKGKPSGVGPLLSIMKGHVRPKFAL